MDMHDNYNISTLQSIFRQRTFKKVVGMKYTVEQKARLRGMNNFMELKIKIGKELGIAQRNFIIVGDFVVIESKMNKNRYLRK